MIPVLNWLRRLVKFLSPRREAPRRREHFEGVGWCDAHADPEPYLRQHQLVLIGSGDRAKWLRFLCPCGCGEVVALNLMARHRPHWSAEHHSDGTLTVTPSVVVTTCQSHFWVRRNRITWV